MSDEIERLLVRVEANATQFEKEMRKLNRTLHGTQADTRKAMASIQQSVDGAAIGIRRSALMASTALATIGVSFGAAQLVRDFRESEESAKRLEAVLKTTGHAAGLTYGEIASWARELEEATGRSATEIQNAAAQLATFTSVGRKEFTAAIEVANDMAAVFGGDLKSNLDAVARALDDPIEGFANLRKRGFALTDAELKRAEAHMKAGRSAEAQQVVLKNLSSQVQGTAAAVNTGITKSLNDLQRQAGDTFKALADQGGTDAAIAALGLASKGVVFLGENMDVLLDAAQAVAVFMATRYAVSVGIATAATLAKAAADVTAKGATEALTAAMAKNPYGLAAVAVAALVSGIVILAKAQTTAEITARAHAKAQAAVAPATSELEKLTRKLVTANDAETASIRRKIDALLAEERLKAQRVRNDYLNAKEVERQAGVHRRDLLENYGVPASAFVDAYGNSTIPTSGGTGPNGNPVDTVRETTELKRKRIEAEEAEKAVRALTEATKESVAESTTPLDYTDKDAKNAAKQAEARRRMVEDMKAAVDLQVAQLTNDQDRVKVLEREEAVRTRARALLDSGIVKSEDAAKAEAERVQARLDDALVKQEQRLIGEAQKALSLDIARTEENYERVRQLESEAELEERIVAYNATLKDLDAARRLAILDMVELDKARADAASRRLKDAQAEHALAIAQLSGNEKLTKQLQDQAAIRERTTRYRTDGQLDPADAERRATQEVTRERLATTYGEHRELFASAFSDGIRAAMAGDLQGFLSNQFGNFADTMFQKAGEQIYDAVFGGVSAATDGVAQGAAISATVVPAITGAGAVAAAEMGAAITLAGAAAGATMAAAIAGASAAGSAASSIPFLFAANGGPVSGPGGPRSDSVPAMLSDGEFVVNAAATKRNRALLEAINGGRVPRLADGGIVSRQSMIPQVNAAMNRVNGAGSRALEQHFHVDARGSVLADALVANLEARGAEMAIQSGTMAVRASRADMAQANRRQRQRFIG